MGSDPRSMDLRPGTPKSTYLVGFGPPKYLLLEGLEGIP